MRLRFALITSDKIRRAGRVLRVSDKIKVGDKVNGQKVLTIFTHQELVARRKFTPTERRSNRGGKELALLAAMMDFVGSASQSNGTELERLLTTAFLAGEERANEQHKTKAMKVLQDNL